MGREYGSGPPVKLIDDDDDDDVDMDMDIPIGASEDLDSDEVGTGLESEGHTYPQELPPNLDGNRATASGNGTEPSPALVSLSPRLARLADVPTQSELSGRRLLAHFLAFRENLPIASIKPSSPPLSPAKPISIIDEDEASLLPRVPPDLVDNTVLRLPPIWPQPLTQHRYLASFSFVQKRTIVSQLTAPSICAVSLVERISLGGPDLILDSHVAMLYFPLECICAQAADWAHRLCELSWAYSRIVVVFEAYPSSHSYSSSSTRPRTLEKETDLPNQYIPPVNNAIKKLKRNLAFSEGTNAKSLSCKIDLVFAKDPGEAARYARMLGNLLSVGGEALSPRVWDSRGWLYDDEFEVCGVHYCAIAYKIQGLSRRTRRTLRVFLG